MHLPLSLMVLVFLQWTSKLVSNKMQAHRVRPHCRTAALMLMLTCNVGLGYALEALEVMFYAGECLGFVVFQRRLPGPLANPEG